MRRISLFLIGVALAGASGCSSCCTPYDNDYPAFGGKWERMDPEHGRVGSAFYDASHQLNSTGTKTVEIAPEAEGVIIDETWTDEVQ